MLVIGPPAAAAPPEGSSAFTRGGQPFAGERQMSSGGDDGQAAWTLGAIKQRNLALEGYCQTEGCGHFYTFNVDNLIAFAGADYVVPDILPGVVCRQCGGELKFKLAMMPPDS
jgi:hypothetical protein